MMLLARSYDRRCTYAKLVSHMPPEVGDVEHAKATQKLIIFSI
jgi:hypothetical protein